MRSEKIKKILVVIPNINGGADLLSAVKSLYDQTLVPKILIVDNASTDESAQKAAQKYPDVSVIYQSKNLGYTGGVNPGFEQAISDNFDYVAPLNNDAVADKHWLYELVKRLDESPEFGIAACKVLKSDGKTIDSTGEAYTAWGLPYPRGRGEIDTGQYDDQLEIFAASGAASLYRVSMLREIGILDQDFFAYYEDVDLSFRAQLAGWKVAFVPTAKVHHKIGLTSNRFKGFTTYQTMKNQPVLLLKNVPRRYLYRIGWRFFVAHTAFFLKACGQGIGWTALKGDAEGTRLLFTGFAKRRHIKSTKKVTDDYIWNMLVHDLPPNAQALRRLRAKWWRLTGKKA